MTRLIWSGPALRDLEGIEDYWMLNNPGRASQILEKITAAARFLTTVPGAGARNDALGVREWSVRSTRYLLLYVHEDDAVIVARVRHSAENWHPLK